MKIKKKAGTTLKNKASHEVYMLYFRKLLQNLWKITLTSKLYAKDKAEILRLLILAFTIVVQTTLFVWLLALMLN